MLVELSVMEQRYQAVLAVEQDGWKVVEVARRLGVSRQSVHAWIARYERGGLAALADRSHRPSTCPHQTAPETEALVCELRREHPGWGPRRIEHQLARSGIDPVPSRSAIYRCLRAPSTEEATRGVPTLGAGATESHRHTAVRSPTTTGKIERFHQSLRREFLLDRAFPSLEAAQAELDAWVADYNTKRPHQALEMATPVERFRLAPISVDGASIPVDPAEDHRGQWVLRRVGSNGYVSVDNQLFSVGNAYKAELVDVFVEETVIQVWSKNHLIKTVARERSGPVRKVRADGLNVKRQPNMNRQASGGA